MNKVVSATIALLKMKHVLIHVNNQIYEGADNQV